MDDVADWCSGGDVPTRSQTDDDLPLRSSSGGGSPRRIGSSRSPFLRLSSLDQPGESRTTDLISFGGDCIGRSEAMAEGTRMLIEALREKLAASEEKCEKTDRERQALNDLLVAKKSDYDDMREHYMDRVDSLNDEVQQLKSEKVISLGRKLRVTAAAVAAARILSITVFITKQTDSVIYICLLISQIYI